MLSTNESAGSAAKTERGMSAMSVIFPSADLIPENVKIPFPSLNLGGAWPDTDITFLDIPYHIFRGGHDVSFDQ